MANKAVKTNISPSIYVDATSRYHDSTVIYYGTKKTITFATYKRKPVRLSEKDRFGVISATTQYRPDLVSFKAYGVPHYWWRIMEFNHIFDIMDFKAGVTIRIPEFL